MRYDFIGVANEDVVESRSAMLLAEFDCCRVGDSCGEGGGVGGGVGRAVGRDIREGVEGDFDREAISAHDIGVLGVVGEVGDATIAEVAVGFFACFVRTCSCSLVLLGNLAEQRLHENASAFSFAMRSSSSFWCLN